MKKKIIITQSNYIPWKGYFDAINTVDEIVLYDDMQYTKRDWRNRNLIKTPNGLKWLSIPVEVKGKFFQSINETKISQPDWNYKHWALIKQNYSKSPYYKEYKDIIEELYLECSTQYLSEINYHFLKGFCELLGITTRFRLSSEFKLAEGRTERLVDICNKMDATDYYSGPAAKSYMDENMFKQNNINIHYLDYTGYPVYDQNYGDFNHGVSILDLIL